MEKLCGNCALQALQGGICPLFNSQMKDNETGCPMFTTHVEYCDICGRATAKGAVIDTCDSDMHILCNNCATTPLCGTCIRINECAFRTDQSCPEPPMVNVQQRQGNMVLQTQIRNPKRIDATCKQGCPCWSDEFGCIKEHQCGCDKYKIRWRE